MKKIITTAWDVMIVLYSCVLAINWTPGPLNSNLIKADNPVPINPAKTEKIKYINPISLALVEFNHLSMYSPQLLILDMFVFMLVKFCFILIVFFFISFDY